MPSRLKVMAFGTTKEMKTVTNAKLAPIIYYY